MNDDGGAIFALCALCFGIGCVVGDLLGFEWLLEVL